MNLPTMTARPDAALLHRLAGLLPLGERGQLIADPDVLGALFHASALLLDGHDAARARNLAKWYDEEAAAA